MGEDRVEIRRVAAGLPSRAALPRRIAKSLYQDWQTFARLLGKANTRLGSARGYRSKLRELRWIIGKGQDRLASRLKHMTAAPPVVQTHQERTSALAMQRMAVSAMLHNELALPACVSIDGGAIAIALATRTAEMPSVYLRDRFANLHSASVIDWHPLSSASGEPLGTCLVVQAPSELMELEATEIDVLLRDHGEQLVFENISIEMRRPVVIHDVQFVNGCVTFSGECADSAPTAFTLGLFVDGALSACCTLSLAGISFSSTIAPDRLHMDGRPHLLELRELPRMSVLASIYRVLPLHLTPWDALQKHARPPLDGTLSPQARHHFRSYQQWFERLRMRGSEGVPPLDELFAEISQGFKKRGTYPKIRFEKSAKPTVSIVIPVHNKCEVTYLCLCSLLFAHNEAPFEIILVDDGSADETTKLATFVEGIQILRHEEAQGFVRACNDGAARARGEFVLLLNNDTQVTARWLDELVATFRNFDRIGLAGSKLVYPDGRLQEAGGIVWRSGNPWKVGRDGNPDDPRYGYLRKVDYVSGAALMIPRSLWNEVGGFSDEFAPAHFEDMDLAMKVRETGHFVVYVPTSTVYHFGGQSAGTGAATGMKSSQEFNRPKFRKKWGHVFRSHGREGESLEREKDRDVAFRVLFIEHQFPFADIDAGSYAAFQEVRLLQSMGAKVTFLPRNLAWMDRHTTALQRAGVECLYAPYVLNFLEYVRAHAHEYDLVMVTRHKIAEQVVPVVRSFAPGTKIAFNLADLHFLRELREAAAQSPGYSYGAAEETRRSEIATVMASDLTLSYSDFEIGILESQLPKGTKLARMPWVVDSPGRATPFAETRDILFLGGFGHNPNLKAVRFFAGEVMPLIRNRLPTAVFDVIGSGARSMIPELKSDQVRILGYVPDLSEPLDRARVFVAPLFAGAGLKGKVLDAIAHGVPCVLSTIAAEGIGLIDGIDCLIANSKEAWADCVIRLYTTEELWNQISVNAMSLAKTRYSFAEGAAALENALATIGISARRDWGLPYRHARPDRYGI
ncbi:MAG TPA: glycosyltransferase [Rhizomicrobium sp.]|nr:glycosyltransferase [Rhizomicrobium sp.]